MPKIFLGVTDNNWFDFLKARNSKEVNFRKPSAGSFKTISENDILLFKLKNPRNCIAGGGFFVNYFRLPISLAWESFKEENGCSSVLDLLNTIKPHREPGFNLNSDIGCIVLTDVFYFDEADYIPLPRDWSTNIVTGKTYDSSVGEGAKLFPWWCLTL